MSFLKKRIYNYLLILDIIFLYHIRDNDNVLFISLYGPFDAQWAKKSIQIYCKTTHETQRAPKNAQKAILYCPKEQRKLLRNFFIAFVEQRRQLADFCFQTHMAPTVSGALESVNSCVQAKEQGNYPRPGLYATNSALGSH